VAPELAQVQVHGTSSQAGSLSLLVTLTDFDQTVTITAPPASQVVAGG